MLYVNTETLKFYILEELDKTEVTIMKDYYFEKNNVGSREGMYIYSDYLGYHMVYSERGNEAKHKITDNLFEIKFWVFDSIARLMSIDYMKKNIKKNENQRKMIFQKKIEILSCIGNNYRIVAEIEEEELLKEISI